jgi:nucleoside-diphosphate-sugar epimerase
MRIAILGATSQIAKDLIVSFSTEDANHLHLFARRPDEVTEWLASVDLAGRYLTDDFSKFGKQEFDAIINFVGSGNPAQTAAMGAAILDVTLQYDEIALEYVRQHPDCRYLFLSSGAAFGSNFDEPVNESTKAVFAINDLKPQDWYAVAKLYAECRHRALTHLAIVDIRIFNYFSRTLDITARFLITDIFRAIRDKVVLKTSSDFIVRDFVTPPDFYKLVNSLLAASATNAAVDCYTLAPIDKQTLLAAMQEKFGLRYEITAATASVNATGNKPHYYSLNKGAADFGYRPSYTSLEGLLIECEAVIGKYD